MWDRPLIHQNHMVDPTKVEIEGDKALFYVENQGVWLWAYQVNSTQDPMVFDREAEPGRAWHSTSEQLSQFLVHVTVFEAILGAPIGASSFDCTRAQLDQILMPLVPVALPAWRWPGPEHRLYCGTDVLAVAGVVDMPGSPTRADSRFEVFLAGASLEALAFLDELPIAWDHSSRTKATEQRGEPA
jgi:hypothetical protein